MMSLRTTVAIGVLAIVAAAPASAQSTRLGAKLGITSATISGDDAEGAESLNGFSGGVFATFPISPAFAIQPEVLYMAKGAAVDIEDEFVADLKFRYVEIPLLAKFSFGTGPLRPHVFAGPYLAFRTSCTVEAEASGVDASVDCDEENLDIATFKETDFGGVAGVGFDYVMAGGVALLLDARLGFGLTDINDSVGDVDAKNRAWSFMVGASFPIGAR